MTIALSTQEVARQITERLPGAVIEASDTAVLISGNSLPDVAAFLKDTPGLEFDYLNHITAIDYYQYFEVVYQFTSIKHNHSIMLKTRC